VYYIEKKNANTVEDYDRYNFTKKSIKSLQFFLLITFIKKFNIYLLVVLKNSMYISNCFAKYLLQRYKSEIK